MAKNALKIVPQYIKNITKSTMYATKDVVSDIMPSTKNFISNNADISKAIVNDLRNLKSISKQAKSAWDNSVYSKGVKDIGKNLVEDLKTGNIYNVKREQEAMMKASGFSDIFDMSDFDFGDMDADLDSDTASSISPEDRQTKASLSTTSAVYNSTAATIGAIGDMSNNVTNSVLAGTKMQIESDTSINTTNLMYHTKMFNEVNSVLNDVATNVRGLFEYTSQMTEYFNASMKMSENISNSLKEMAALNKELTEMQRNMYQEYNAKPYRKENENTFVNSNGDFDLQAYLKTVIKRGKKQWDESYINSMGGMMDENLGAVGGLLQAFAGSPLKGVAKGIASASMSKELKKSMANLDKTVDKFFQSLFLKFSSTFKEKGEDNPIYELAYKMFGLDLGTKQFTSTDKYVKGPVPYNGYADKAIVDVIPTYLRKILSAMTGEEELIYDYTTGKFKNMTATKRAYDNAIDTSYNGISGTKYYTKQKLKAVRLSKEAEQSLNKDVDEFFKFLIDTGHYFNPDKDTFDRISELGANLESGANYRLIKAALESLGKNNLMNLNSEIISGIETRKNEQEKINKNLSQYGFSALFNGSIPQKTLGKISRDTNVLSINDGQKYSSSMSGYLADIRNILLEGIKVYKVEGNIPNIGNNIDYDNRMKRYHYEVQKVSDYYEKEEAENKRRKEDAHKSNFSFFDIAEDVKLSDQALVELFSREEIAEKEKEQTELEKAMGSVLKEKTKFKKITNFTRDLASAPEKVVMKIFDNVNDNLLLLLYGNKKRSGLSLFDEVAGNLNKTMDDLKFYMISTIFNPIKKVLIGENGVLTKLKSKLSDKFDKAKDKKNSILGKISNKLFGDSATSEMSLSDFYQRNIAPRMPRMFKGLGIGALIGLISPLGIIGTTFMGGAIGLASTSDKVKNVLFGEIGEDGNRKGGIIPQSIIEKFKNGSKNMGIGAAIGAASSLFTPLGLFGGTLLGSVGGFITSLDSVKDFLFGKMGDDGTRDDANAIFKQEWIRSFKEKLPGATLGAGLGVLGSIFLPGGPIFGAVAGFATAMGLQKDNVKKFLFGELDPIDNQRHGGMFGKLFNFLKVEIATPLKLYVKDIFNNVGYWVKENVVNPFLNALEPLKKQFSIMKDAFVESVKNGWASIKEKVGNMFEDHVGKPLGKVIKENLTDPLKKFFSNFFSKIGSAIGTVLAAPFKGLENTAMDYLAKHKKDGVADYEEKMMAKKRKRHMKAYNKYISKKGEIQRERDINRQMGQILEDNDYSDEAITKVEAMRGTTWATAKVQDNILTAAQKGSDYVKKIFDFLVNTGKDFSNARKEAKENYKYDKRAYDHNKRVKQNIGMTNDTPDVIIPRDPNEKIKDRTVSITTNIRDIIKNKVVKNTDRMVNAMEDMASAIRRAPGEYRRISLTKKSPGKGSHAGGLDNVPNDNYNADLHKGEMVLPSDVANYFRVLFGLDAEEGSSAKGTTNNRNAFINGLRSNLNIGSNPILERINSNLTSMKKTLDFSTAEGEKEISSPTNNILYYTKKTKENTEKILNSIDGQVNGVGYHTELIANLLTEKLGMPKNMPNGERKFSHKIKTKFQSIKDFLLKPFSWVKEKIMSILGIAHDAVSGLFNAISSTAKAILDIPKKLLSVGWEILKGVGSFAKESIKAVGSVLGEVAKGIPKVLGVIGAGLKETFKVLSTGLIEVGKFVGTAAIETAKTIGTATRHVIGAIGQTAKGFIKLAGTVIPAVAKAFGGLTKTILNLAKKGIKGLFGLIASPFKKLFGKIFGNKDKVANKIKTVGEVALLDKVNTVVKVENVEKINDARIYKKFDTIISLLRSNNNSNGGNLGSEDSGDYQGPTETPFTIDATADEGLFTKFKSKISGIKGKLKNSGQVAAFNMKEQLESSAKKIKEKIRLNKNALKSQIETGKIIFNRFGKKSLFGIISDLAPLILPHIFKFFSKIKKAGGLLEHGISLIKTKIFPKVNKWFIDKVSPVITKISTAIGSLGKTLWTKLSTMTSRIVAAIKGQAISDSIGDAADTIKDIKKLKNAKNAASAGQMLLETGAAGAGGTAGKQLLLGGGSGAAKNAAKEAAEYAAKDAARYGSKATIINGVEYSVKGATKAGKLSTLITKIMNSAPMKKVAGSSFGKVLSKLGKYLVEKLSPYAAKLTAKISAKWGVISGTGAVSGGLITAAYVGMSLLNSISKTNQLLELSPNYEPPKKFRLIAGFAEFLDSNLTMGFIPAKTIAYKLIEWLCTDDEKAELQKAQGNFDEEYQKYVEDTGRNISKEEYNKRKNKSMFTKAGHNLTANIFDSGYIREKYNIGEDEDISLGTRVKSGLSTLANKATGNLFASDYDLEKITGKKAKDITIGDRAKIFASTFANNATFGFLGEDKIYEKINKLTNGGEWLVGKVKDGMDSFNTKIKHALWYSDSWLGSIFNTTDEKGNPITLTDAIGNKFSDAKNSIKSAASGWWNEQKAKWAPVKETASKLANYVGDGIDSFKNSVSNAVDGADQWLGNVFGLTDEKGNPISLSKKITSSVSGWWNKQKDRWNSIKGIASDAVESVKKGFTDFKNGIGNFFSNLGTGISNTWGSVKNWFGDKVDSIKNWFSDKKEDADTIYKNKLAQEDAGSGVDSQSFYGKTQVSSLNSANIPYLVNGAAYYSQNDEKWARTRYGDNFIGNNGCGPVTAAMFLSSILGKEVTPKDTIDFAKKNNYFVKGGGTSEKFFKAVANEYGTDVYKFKNKQLLKPSLQAGYPVILSGKGGAPFTKDGHIVLATGLDKSGNVLINDPLNPNRNGAYKFKDVKKRTKMMWRGFDESTGEGMTTQYDNLVKIANGEDVSEDSEDSKTSEASTTQNDWFSSQLQTVADLTSNFVTSAVLGKNFDSSTVTGSEDAGSGFRTRGVGFGTNGNTSSLSSDLNSSYSSKGLTTLDSKAMSFYNEVANKLNTAKDNVAQYAAGMDLWLATMFGIVDTNGNPVKATDNESLDDAINVWWNKFKNSLNSISGSATSVWKSVKSWFRNKISGSKNKSTISTSSGVTDNTISSTNTTGSINTGASSKKDNVFGQVTNSATAMGSGTSLWNVAGNGEDRSRFYKGAGFGANNPYSPEVVNGAAYYSQNDSRWANSPYTDYTTISRSGCGPTSAAMLISSVTGKTVDPEMTATFGANNGYYIRGAGTSFDFFPAVAKEYGTSLSQNGSFNDAYAKLQAGVPTIFSGQGSKPFTSGGHLIFSPGLDQSGNIIINDPVSKERSIAYSPNTISSQYITSWSAPNGSTLNTNFAGSSSGSSATTTDSTNSSLEDALEEFRQETNNMVMGVVNNTGYTGATSSADGTTGTASYSGGTLNVPSDIAVGTQPLSSDVKKYIGSFVSAGNQYNVDPYVLAAISMQESGGKANSSNGYALGLMQIENTKADEFANFGLQTTGSRWTLDDRADPNKAIPFAASVVGGDLTHYNGDYLKAIQAYNFSHYSLDKLIGVYGDNWRAHTGEMGQLNGWGGSYGDKDYIPHVLRYYHANGAGAGNGGDRSKYYKAAGFGEGGTKGQFNKAVRSYLKKKKVSGSGEGVSDSNAVKTNDSSKYNLEINRSITNNINDYLSAKNITAKTGMGTDKIDVIISLLSKISDNTDNISENTSELTTKEFNIVLDSNTIDTITDSKEKVETNTSNKQNKSNLNNISSSKGTGSITEAYKKAMMIARGQLT